MLDFVISSAANLLRIYLIYRFVQIFFGETVKTERRKVFLVCASFFIINIALYWIFHTMWINMVCNLVGISGIVWLYTKSIKTNLFVTGAIYLINAGCDAAGTLLFIRYVDGQKFNQIYEVISVFMILVCLFLVGRIVTIHENAEQTQNVSLILVPISSIAVICILIHLDICEDLGIAVVALGLLVINFFMLYLYNQLLHTISQKYETEMLKNQVQFYSNQLNVILQSERKAKALRHDMKHHMNELKLLANRYGAKDIENYIDHMEDFIHNPKEFVASGNVEIDSVLNYMLHKAKEVLRTVNAKIMLPEEIKHSFDLNVLIGNLLENAIEAAQKTERKYLNVYIALKKGVLVIQVDNSFIVCTILEKGDKIGNRILLSTKEKKEQHGIGLSNVKKIVESYNGKMDIQIQEDIFSVKLFLYISKIENMI